MGGFVMPAVMTVSVVMGLMCLFKIWTKPECCLFPVVYCCCGGGNPESKSTLGNGIMAGAKKIAGAQSAFSHEFRDRDRINNGRAVVTIKISPMKTGDEPDIDISGGDYHPGSKKTQRITRVMKKTRDPRNATTVSAYDKDNFLKAKAENTKYASERQRYAEHKAKLDGEVVSGPNGQRFVPNRVKGIKAQIQGGAL
jgi:hypothetical protein